jgi:hypothetical protein
VLVKLTLILEYSRSREHQEMDPTSIQSTHQPLNKEKRTFHPMRELTPGIKTAMDMRVSPSSSKLTSPGLVMKST